MIRYYGRLMMGLLMDESARRSYDADRDTAVRGLSALRDLASPAVGDEVTVLPDHDVGLVTHPNNWVLRVELFKYQFA